MPEHAAPAVGGKPSEDRAMKTVKEWLEQVSKANKRSRHTIRRSWVIFMRAVSVESWSLQHVRQDAKENHGLSSSGLWRNQCYKFLFKIFHISAGYIQ